jgi:hypothetical protein
VPLQQRAQIAPKGIRPRGLSRAARLRLTLEQCLPWQRNTRRLVGIDAEHFVFAATRQHAAGKAGNANRGGKPPVHAHLQEARSGQTEA